MPDSVMLRGTGKTIRQYRRSTREELCHMNNEPAMLEVEQRIKWVEDKFVQDKWMKDARLHV